MADFSITSALRLQKPSNLNQISSLIKNKLERINVNVDAKIDKAAARRINEINTSLKQTKKQTDIAADSMESFGKQTAITIKRFGAYTLVTAGFFRFIGAVTDGIKEAIQFQDELIKISQVTGDSLFALSGLRKEVDRLSTSLGVSSKELLNSSRTLAQAGFSAKEVKTALEALAKTDLAPTFDNLNDTTESMIAALRQFGFEVEDLESKFSSINAVAAKFAVESGDISAAIRRTGGAFAAAGGSVEELIGLFTSVRATTRESAESIATGFRTIFTRIQRSRTQNSLKELGIDLKNAEGLFVGPFEAVMRLSDALGELATNDPRFSQITEELGGFRQISKVIPLIRQASTAQAAYGVALRGTNSLSEDAVKRQESLAIKIEKVREEFQKLLRTVGENELFNLLADAVLSLSKSLNALAASLTTVIPALLPLVSKSIGRSAVRFGSGLAQSLSSNRNVAFADGGKIAGVGNKDSELIAAMPGEYVIRKSAVQKYGSDFFDNLNKGKIGKFANGGRVSLSPKRLGASAALGALALPSLTGLGGLDETAQDLEKSFKDIILQTGILFTALSFGNQDIQKFSDEVESVGKTLADSEVKYDQLNKELSTRSTLIKQTESSIASSKSREGAIISNLERQRSSGTAGSRLITPPFATHEKGIGAATSSVVNQERSGRRFKKQILKEQQEEAKLLRIQQEEIKNKIDLDKAEQLEKQKQITKTKLLTAGIAAGAAAVNVFGQTLKDWAQEDFADLRAGRSFDEAGARTQFVGGSALTGAGFGGIAGAGLAAAVGGPVGIIAGLGAIGFAAFEGSSALSEFEKQVKQINAEKIGGKLSDSLASVQEGNSPRALSGQVNSSVRALADQLVSETDSDISNTLSNTLDSSVTGLIDFVKASARVSTSLKDLDAVVSLDTLQAVADRTGKTLEEYRDSLEKSIEEIQEQNKERREQLRRTRDFEIGILSQRALNVAAKTAAASLNDLSGGLTNILDSGLNFGRGATGAFEQISAGINPRGGTGDIMSFANNFGGAAELLGKKSIEAANAVEVLPNILLRLRSADPLGQSGDFLNRLGNELEKSNIGDEVTNAILDQVSGIIGAEGKDVTIVKQLNENFLETINKITTGLIERNSGLFSELESSTNEALKRFNEGLSKGAAILSSITDRRLRINDNNRGFQGVLSGVTGQTDFGALRQLDRRRTNIVTGGRGQNELFRELERARGSRNQLNEDFSNTGNLEERRKILVALNKEEQTIQRVNRALDHLSDVSARTATAQQQLQQATEDREKRGGLLRDIAFGNKDQNAALSRNVAAAKLLQVIPDIGQIPQQFRGEVRGFLERLGDTQLKGLDKTGNEILKSIELAFANRAGIDPKGIITASEKEQALLTEIRDATNTANQIEQGRVIQDQIFLRDLNNNLTSNFKDFISSLKSQIDRIFESEQQQKVTALQGDINTTEAIVGAGKRITDLTGVDAQTVFSNFKQIKENFEDIGRSEDLLNALGRGGETGIFGGQSQSPDEARRELLSPILDNADKIADDLFTGRKTGIDVFSDFIDKTSEENPELGAILSKKLRNNEFSDQISVLNEDPLSFLGLQQSKEQSIAEIKSVALNIFPQIREELENQLSDQRLRRSDIARSVGGEQNLLPIIKRIPELEPLIKNLPDDTNFSELKQELSTLKEQLRILNTNGVNVRTGDQGQAAGNNQPVGTPLLEGFFSGIGGMFTNNTPAPNQQNNQQADEAAKDAAKRVAEEEARQQKQAERESPAARAARLAAARVPEEVRKQREQQRIAEMEANLADIDRQLEAALGGRGFNTGGFVPGRGNRDTVSARLTPGEFVMNKGAVQRFGTGVFERMNKQSFNSGGLVKNNIDMSAINAINLSMNKFSVAADRLSQAISSIPSEISLKGSYRLEIVHNGAQMFQSLEPRFAELVNQKIDEGLNRLIHQKFPEVGPL